MSKSVHADNQSVGPTLDAPTHNDRTTLVDLATEYQRFADWNVYDAATGATIDTLDRCL